MGEGAGVNPGGYEHAKARGAKILRRIAAPGMLPMLPHHRPQPEGFGAKLVLTGPLRRG
jgi:3-oxoacyl-(acyl-carrier-protein) synthase